SISEYTLSPEVVEPGTSGVLQITVSNTGVQTDTVESVTITVTSVEALGIDRSFAVGDLESGASVLVSLPFEAAENIASGYYTVEVRAIGLGEDYYLDSNNQLKSKTESFEKRASIPVQVVEQPVLSIALSEESIEDLTEETFTFTNDGGKAKKVKVTILNEGIGFLNQDQLYLTELDGSAAVTATLDARGAQEGATKLQFQLAYQNALGTEMTETKSIPITVKKAEGDFVFVQQGTIVTGENENLQLKLTNEGKAVTNLRFTFQSDDVRLRGLNEFTVGDITSGETKSLTVPLVADLPPGTQNVILSITWEESGEDRMGTVTVPLEVISDSTVGVFLEAKPTPLTVGAEHTISVTVSNLGSYNIEGTTVELESEAFTLLTIQPQQYIGGLESDDFSSVQYKVIVNSLEPGTYPTKVKVTFRDESGAWVTLEEETTIGISAAVQEEVCPMPMLAIGVAILLVVGYWWFRMRKKK
ncbi:MAG: hypothetical protein GY852_08525, partial [bacterium]|nr:hypothetical protein [bacterium]